MLLPIGHDHAIRRTQWVTYGIIILCTLVQLYSTFIAPSESELLSRADDAAVEMIRAMAPGSDPDDVELNDEQRVQLERRIDAMLDARPEHRFGYVTGTGVTPALITSTFVHGGWFHLIGNMLFLWLAGSALEDRYGRLRFALFYLLGGGAAAYGFDIAAGEDGILLIGASGAVAACMGAFLVHFHKTQIRFWYLWMLRSGTFYWPAWFALPLWLAEQFLWAKIEGAHGGVAYSAHIAGFVVGVIIALLMNVVFPEDRTDEGGDEPALPQARVMSAAPAKNARDPRIDRIVEALDRKDTTTVWSLASRVLIERGRVNDDAQVLELYRILEGRLTNLPLTDGAFMAVTTAAERATDQAVFVTAAGQMIAQHPGSSQTAQVMWRLAEVQESMGNHELAQSTLRQLAERFPRTPLGQRAAQRL